MFVGEPKEAVKIAPGSEGRPGSGSVEQVGLREGHVEEIDGAKHAVTQMNAIHHRSSSRMLNSWTIFFSMMMLLYK